MAALRSLDMIAKLIGFPTVSRDSNLALIDYVRDYLAGQGVASRIVPNDEGTKANLYATIGPNVEGGVILSGHTDVVPVDGQPWDTDPFNLVERDGKLYGRGTCDMKSFSAIALALVPDMLAAGLKRPIHLALTYDEEVGCLGAPSLIERMAQDLPKPLAAIVGEPTMMDIVTGHKGVAGIRTMVTGHEAHSSQIHRGVSAVMTAARLIGFIETMLAENRAKADPTSRFDPPFTTLHVGKISGGTALNIISRHCEFIWDVRCVPGEKAQDYLDRFRAYCEAEILPEMRRIAPETDILSELLTDTPSLLAEEDGAAVQLCKALTGRNTTMAVPYGAEAGQYDQAGFSTVLCGPGSIDQAHQPNEFIAKDQVAACEAFIGKLIARLAV